MGFIGGLFSGDGGSNFQAQNPATMEQMNQAYRQTQAGLGQQQAFVNALAAQGGIGNQSSVFGQQQNLANQLQAQSLGQGANPAQAMLANATGQNAANQAALMASQRGMSANPGMIARQAAMTGANVQQQAAGQGALMQAQQQLAAQNQLAAQQQAMGNLASQQVAQQAGALQGYNAAAHGIQQNLYGANNSANSANAQVASGKQSAQGGILSGIAGGIGTGLMMLSKGGEVPAHMPASLVGQHFYGMKSGGLVPGQAVVQGDSLKNDSVPAMLSPKEIVLPRSITMDKNAPEKAKAFVEAILARSKSK